MTEDDEALRAKLRGWTIAPLDNAVRDRLLAMALQTPQARPFWRGLGAEIEHALSDWRYGLGYKLAAGAACLVLGMGIGWNSAEPMNVADVAMFSNLGEPS